MLTNYIMWLKDMAIILSISKIKPETRNLKPQTRTQNRKQEPVFLTVIRLKQAILTYIHSKV